jgi:hypothetical protein
VAINRRWRDARAVGYRPNAEPTAIACLGQQRLGCRQQLTS